LKFVIVFNKKIIILGGIGRHKRFKSREIDVLPLLM